MVELLLLAVLLGDFAGLLLAGVFYVLLVLSCSCMSGCFPTSSFERMLHSCSEELNNLEAAPHGNILHPEWKFKNRVAHG